MHLKENSTHDFCVYIGLSERIILRHSERLLFPCHDISLDKIEIQTFLTFQNA